MNRLLVKKQNLEVIEHSMPCHSDCQTNNNELAVRGYARTFAMKRNL